MDAAHFARGHRESAIEGIDPGAKHTRLFAASDDAVPSQVGVRGNDPALLGVLDAGVFVRMELID